MSILNMGCGDSADRTRSEQNVGFKFPTKGNLLFGCHGHCMCALQVLVKVHAMTMLLY